MNWFVPTCVSMIGLTPGIHRLTCSTLVTVLPAFKKRERPNSVTTWYRPENNSGKNNSVAVIVIAAIASLSADDVTVSATDTAAAVVVASAVLSDYQ